jgi:hypothetical protein
MVRICAGREGEGTVHYRVIMRLRVRVVMPETEADVDVTIMGIDMEVVRGYETCSEDGSRD